MKTFFILSDLCILSLLSIFSIIYYIKLKNNKESIEIINKENYLEGLKYLKIIWIMFFIITIICPTVAKYISFELEILESLISGVIAMMAIVLLVISFGYLFMNKKKKLEIELVKYKKLKKNVLTKYLIVMSILILGVYPLLYLGVYFLTNNI